MYELTSDLQSSVTNFESMVVVHDLADVINLALYGFLCNFGIQYMYGNLSIIFFGSYPPLLNIDFIMVFL